jgi:hypothetical protein
MMFIYNMLTKYDCLESDSKNICLFLKNQINDFG